MLPARAQEPSPVNAENGYGYYWSAQLGIPIEILHENEPIVPDLERLGSIDKCIVFPSSTFETGKHYSIQLVNSTDGGANYTSVGGYSPTPIPGTSTSVVAPADSDKKSSDPKPPYWSDCYSRIKELGESNVPQTLVYEEGMSLPIGVMQALQEYPNVTLIFRCSYNDTEYEFTIRGDEAKIVIKTAALTK